MTDSTTTRPAPSDFGPLRIAVLVPCRNEAGSVGRVVADFRDALPGALVYVYDNASEDETAELAAEAGAIVRSEPLPGKGNVVRRMFADVDADVYVLVDGDSTYDAASAPAMVKRLLDGRLDLVNGRRRQVERHAYRFGHRLGNRLINAMVGAGFGRRFDDLLSGYRVLSRRFVKSFPALARGFEIETEMAVHALELRLPVTEMDTAYRARRRGGASKLSTLRDGARIAATILWLLKEVRPLLALGSMAALSALLGLALGVPLVLEYLATGLVPRFPTAVLVTGLMVLAGVLLVAGLIMDSVARGRREAKRMNYLALPPAALPDELGKRGNGL